MASNITFNIDHNVNAVFDEAPNGSAFLAFRRLSWGSDNKYRYDMRKWFVDADGNESPHKGFSFMTEDGPHNLTHSLLDLGFGDTKKSLEAMQDREDFFPSVKAIVNEKGINLDEVEDLAESSDDYFDPKDMFEDDAE